MVLDRHDVVVEALGGLVHEEAVVRSDDDVRTRLAAGDANAFVLAIDNVHHLTTLATLSGLVHRVNLRDVHFSRSKLNPKRCRMCF